MTNTPNTDATAASPYATLRPEYMRIGRLFRAVIMESNGKPYAISTLTRISTAAAMRDAQALWHDVTWGFLALTSESQSFNVERCGKAFNH